MKKIISIIVLTFCTFCIPAFADSEQDTEYTALDNVLPGGMTVAETLEEWDNSAMRYHSEPPQVQLEEEEANNS